MRVLVAPFKVTPFSVKHAAYALGSPAERVPNMKLRMVSCDKYRKRIQAIGRFAQQIRDVN